MGKITIIKPGVFSTLQDLGRLGFSRYGVPISGAMDLISYKYANALLGNDDNSVCIEWAIQPPVLRFDAPTVICLTGAKIDAYVNGVGVCMYKPIFIKKNDVLELNSCRNEIYGYVGVKNGFNCNKIMGSGSFFKSITDQYVLSKDDLLYYNDHFSTTEKFANLAIDTSINQSEVLFFFKGPEFDLLSKKQQNLVLNSTFSVSSFSNRMAIQLQEKLVNKLPSILTSAVLPGTVQLPPSGTLIVLMRDCQTTGGYPRILQLTEESINCIAQKRMNEQVKFRIHSS